VSRRLILMLVATTFGGGWLYMGGKSPQAPNPYGQPQSTYVAPSQPVGYTPPAKSSKPLSSLFGGGQQAPAPPQTPINGGPTVRIASFNIQVFGDEKAKYAGIMQTLAAVVRNFHIVAIQEIRTQNGYHLDNFLRNYVNADGKHYYDYVIGPRLGRSASKEQYAYIFDTTAIEVNRQGIYTVNDPQDLLHREPLVAMFRVRGPAPQEAFTFVLVNVHTDPDEVKEEVDVLADVYQAVRQASGGEDDIIILGDLNADDTHLGRLGKIPGVRPLIRGAFTNTRRDQLYDNIVIHVPSTAEFTGRWGVFDIERVQDPPLSREMALQVSDHLPIWAEFSAYESAAPGRVATRPGPNATVPLPR
jgi:deoxyribonuclease-1-like protein